VPLVYIALGSNLGDRIGQMRQAVELLQHDGRVCVLRTSPVYQNRAIGMGAAAADFLNAVVEVNSTLEPLELLDACLDVEQQLGRSRSGEGWAPRTIDLDLLIYAGVTVQEARLTLPHPRIAERDFVAVPLADLAPELDISGRSARELAAGLAHNELTLYPKKLPS
jgi:2-amino-4-hydroxy-6-hydroxymethyldihydropteridine diphosphokinase